MRQIELQMLGAIAAKKSWQSGNTSVVYEPEVLGELLARAERAKVYLHGNHIATLHYRVVGHDAPVPIRNTFRAWPTPTTASRLRALGVDASIKDFQACINGVPV